MLLLHAYLGVAPLSGRVARAEKQLATYYDDNYGDGRQLDRLDLRGHAERSERLRRARERGGGLHNSAVVSVGLHCGAVCMLSVGISDPATPARRWRPQGIVALVVSGSSRETRRRVCTQRTACRRAADRDALVRRTAQ